MVGKPDPKGNAQKKKKQNAQKNKKTLWGVTTTLPIEISDHEAKKERKINKNKKSPYKITKNIKQTKISKPIKNSLYLSWIEAVFILAFEECL